VVTNTGTVDLADVRVTDEVVTNNGTASDPAGVVCDWANSSDAATPARNLSIGETVTCLSESTAAAGQYMNNGKAIGTPVADAATADPDNPDPLRDPDGNRLPEVEDEDPSHYFGPEMDLALRKQFADGSNDKELAIGDEVTYTITVFNQGNVHATGIAIIDYLPEGLELADSDWTSVGANATAPLAGVVLAPGDSTSIDVTVKVAGPEDADFENSAEITLASASDRLGGELVDGDGEPLDLDDVDSSADNVDGEDPVDDAILNEGGDEDDHDRAGGITIKADPATPSIPTRTVVRPPLGSGVPMPNISRPSTPSTPQRPSGPLAFTGSEASTLAVVGLALIGTGGALVIGVRRRRDDVEEASQ